jgi:hypothetical protein
MCQVTPGGAVWDTGMRILASYPFQDSVRQLIFDTLREIPSSAPKPIREELLRRMVNKGFPDIDLDPYFQPHHLDAAEVLALMQAVCAGASNEETA